MTEFMRLIVTGAASNYNRMGSTSEANEMIISMRSKRLFQNDRVRFYVAPRKQGGSHHV